MEKYLDKCKFYGRHTYKNGVLTFYNGGSGLGFKMQGRKFAISLDIKPQGYIYVILDKDYNNKTKFLVKSPLFSYEMPDNKTHYVDIIKANEANDNVMEITNIEVDGILNYDFDHKYKVRVYGDSTIAGFGILAKDGEASIHNSDSVRDFCFHTLYESGYDFDIMSASGWGLTFSAYTNPNEIGIIDFQDNVMVNSTIKNDSDFKPDLLIVSLGTNDYSYIKIENERNRIECFKEKYKQLLLKEVENNKNIKILMLYGTLKESDVYPLIEETYEYLKPRFKNIYLYKMDGDNSAISNHAFVNQHDLMAKQLKTKLKELL